MASDSQDTKTLKDILDVLNASNAKGKLVNIKAAKLGNPVQKLSNHDDPGIKAVAAGLVQKWKALANDKVKPAAGGPAAAAAAGAPSPSAPPEATVPKTEPKPEPAEATNEAARPTPAATASSSSSDRKPGQVVPTGDAIRDSVVQKLHEVFKKGVATHEAFLRGHDSDPAAMAQARTAPAPCASGAVRARTRLFSLRVRNARRQCTRNWAAFRRITRLATGLSCSTCRTRRCASGEGRAWLARAECARVGVAEPRLHPGRHDGYACRHKSRNHGRQRDGQQREEAAAAQV